MSGAGGYDFGDSNTTLVKVKLKILKPLSHADKNSNTTLVKVKYD